MKILTVKHKTNFGSYNRLSVLLSETETLDLNLCWKLYFEKNGYYNTDQRADHKMPSNLSEMLSTSENPIELCLETVELYKQLKKTGDLKTRDGASLTGELSDNSKITLPLPKINCYRDFYTHEKHVATGFKKRNEPIPEPWFELPVYYKGATSGFIGNGDEILWPAYSKKLDYELELAAVVGRDGFNIKAKDAFKHIFGFTILNDVSARDIQKKEMAVRLGPSKGKDFCSVLGPVIVTSDEFSNKSPNLAMKAFVNGELWSEGQSGDAKYSWEEMVEFASSEEWLRATDVMGSGTVGTGCGLELDKWIKHGDEIDLWVESIGHLVNKVK